jgi:hypothetical protein
MVKRAFFFFLSYYILFFFLNVALVVAVLDLISGIHLLERILVHLFTVIASYF